MPIVRVMEHGQITIPKKFRDALKLEKGDLADAMLQEDGKIVIVPQKVIDGSQWGTLRALLDEVHAQNESVSEEEVIQDVTEAVREYRQEKYGKAGK